MSPPWSEIGRLQEEIRSLTYKLNQCAQSHEVHQIKSDVQNLERNVRELESTISSQNYEIETFREDIQNIKETLAL